MKYVLSFLVMLITVHAMRAQEFAYSGRSDGGYEHFAAPRDTMHLTHLSHLKCRGTRIGTDIMIVGGAVAVIGGLGLVTPWAKNNDPDKTGAGVKTASTVAVVGVSIGIIGIVIHVIGQEYDDKHAKRLGVVSGNNNIGLAWRF
jgi:hypothetical protein